MLIVSDTIKIPEDELECQFIRSQGAGGQHVNKTATAVQLHFNFLASPSLPEDIKQRLLSRRDRRISQDGIIIIKAQRYRSQAQNREDAFARLADIINLAAIPIKKRRPTKPTRSSKERRHTDKTRDAQIKKMRGKVSDGD
ncbi:MAG: class I peptide chain release factor [Deltaproteobacteria bacterium RIFOXYD12_FULL_50_9]|nr:MAG: class I peptide chain release factor [Deltaproteobacteria bacterium RIFOXYD12_FULL_50_9]